MIHKAFRDKTALSFYLHCTQLSSNLSVCSKVKNNLTMRTKSILYYLAIGFLIMGIFLGEAEARRKILRGRKTITRRYYRGTAIPAWSIVVIAGLSMLIAGGGVYFAMKRLLIDSIEFNDMPSYQPAMQDEV